MRLTSIHIQGLKVLSGVRIDDLAWYNAIIGPNNSGKSSIAEALMWAHYHSANTTPLDGAIFFAAHSAEYKRFYEEHITPDDAFVRLSLVSHDDTEPEQIHGTIIPNSSSFIANSHVKPNEGKEHILFREFVSLLRYYGPFEQLTSQQHSIQDAETLSRSGHNLSPVLHWYASNRPEAFEAIETSFTGVMPEMTHIRTQTDGSRSYTTIDVQEGGRHRLASMGDGVARVLGWLTALHTSPRRASIFLEEPEVGLHPSLQRRLKRELRAIATRRGQQLLVLTHSPTWADVEVGSQLYQLSTGGTAVSLTGLQATANAVGSRPSDAGYADVILYCEGDSEEAALPLLFSLAQRTLSSMGVYLLNLKGHGRARRLADDVRLTRSMGQRLHVCLDWADHPAKSQSDLVKTFGVAADELTLWARDGGPGVFEDIFPTDVLYEALVAYIGEDGAAPTLEGFTRELAEPGKKTDDTIARLYHQAVPAGSLTKPDFCRLAAEICLEQGTVPSQVEALIRALAALVE